MQSAGTTGQVHNPLFYYIENQYPNNPDTPDPKQLKPALNIGDREYYILHLLRPSGEASNIALNIELPGHHLICVDAHISIDKFMASLKQKKNESKRSFFLTPAHASFDFVLDNRYELNAHLYYNESGSEINFKITSNSSMTLSNQIQDHIHRFIYNLVSPKIEKLIADMQQHCQGLQTTLNQLEADLAMQLDEFIESDYENLDRKHKAITILENLTVIAGELFNYQMTDIGNRNFWYQQWLDFLTNDQNPERMATNLQEPDGLDNQANQSSQVNTEHKKSKKKHSKKIKKTKKKVPGKQTVTTDEEIENKEIELAISNNALLTKFSFNTSESSLAEKMTSTDQKCQALFSERNSTNIVSGIKEILHTDPFYDMTKLIYVHYQVLFAHLRTCVLNGEYDEVVWLHPLLVPIDLQDMKNLYQDFLIKILYQTESDMVNSLANIGDYFYENSADYRASVYALNNATEMVILQDVFQQIDKERQHSLMFVLFIQNKITAFHLLLRHGVRAISASTECKYQNVVVSLPVAIIIDFKSNPNIEFIRLLREYNALNETDLLITDFSFSDLADQTQEGHVQNLTQMKHPLEIALRRMRHSINCSSGELDLVKDLVKYSDVRSLIYQLPNLVNSPSNRFSVLAVSDRLQLVDINIVPNGCSSFGSIGAINVLPSRELYNNLIKANRERIGQGIKQVLVYFSENEPFYEIISFIIESIIDAFKKLSIDEQRSIVLSISDKIESIILAPNNSHKITMAVAAQLLMCLVTNKSNEFKDYLMHIRLYALKTLAFCKSCALQGDTYVLSKNIESAKMEYTNLHNLYEMTKSRFFYNEQGNDKELYDAIMTDVYFFGYLLFDDNELSIITNKYLLAKQLHEKGNFVMSLDIYKKLKTELSKLKNKKNNQQIIARDPMRRVLQQWTFSEIYQQSQSLLDGLILKAEKDKAMQEKSLVSRSVSAGGLFSGRKSTVDASSNNITDEKDEKNEKIGAVASSGVG